MSSPKSVKPKAASRENAVGGSGLPREKVGGSDLPGEKVGGSGSPGEKVGGSNSPGEKVGGSAFPVSKEPDLVGRSNPPGCEARAISSESPGAKGTNHMGSFHHAQQKGANETVLREKEEALIVLAGKKATERTAVGRMGPPEREAAEMLGGTPKQIGGASDSGGQTDAHARDAAGPGLEDCKKRGAGTTLEAADLL